MDSPRLQCNYSYSRFSIAVPNMADISCSVCGAKEKKRLDSILCFIATDGPVSLVLTSSKEMSGESMIHLLARCVKITCGDSSWTTRDKVIVLSQKHKIDLI